MKRRVVLLLTLILTLFMTSCGSTVKMRADAAEYAGQLYDSVYAEIEKTGFTNIQSTEIDDLTSDSSMADFTVESVSIDGNTSFAKKDVFNKDAPVEIIYHIIPKLQTPMSSDSIQEQDYTDIANVFQEAGFINVTAEEAYDIDPDVSDEIYRNEVSINGITAFPEGEDIPFDATISVVCHRPYVKHTVNMSIDFQSNLLFSKYDVSVAVNDEQLGVMPHGEDTEYQFRIAEGICDIIFAKENSTKATGTVQLDVSSDVDVVYKISCYNDHIDVSEESIAYHESEANNAQLASDAAESEANPSVAAPTPQTGTSANSVDYDWPDGVSYTGGYKDGEANGYGEMTFPDEGTYKGNFVDGKRSGFGTFSWENGDSYSGNWKEDAMDGQGTYTFADGYVMDGTWSKNQFIGNTSDGVLSLEEPVEQIQLNYGDYVLALNDTVALQATISPDTATYQTLTWTSSDTSVANVTANGVVTAYSVGETTISVTADNGVTATCYIKVYQEITSLWDGNWSIVTTDSSGSYEGTSYGTCTISTDTMTVTVGDGSPISLTASGESTLTGAVPYGSYTGELCYTSLNEYQILLEINWVYTAIGYDDVVTTYYFLLTRVEG